MDFSKLEAFLESLPKRGIPLCNIAVSYGGEIVYKHSVNCEDDSLFWIFSTSKVSVCTAAMRLVEQGKINLDDPVSKYIPAFGDMMVKTEEGIVPCKTPMKIVHLFTMTGGLDYNNTPEMDAANAAQLSTVGVAEAIAKAPLNFEPGTHYLYSNCHDVLGAVVEVVSGMTLAEYLRKEVYEPLGMFDTGFDPTDEQRARIVKRYNYNNGTCDADLMDPIVRPYENPNYYSGGGGLFSSTADYIKLMTTLALGGTSPEGYQLLKPETVKMMGENLLDETCLAEFRNGRLYGYGWGLCGRNHMDPDRSLSISSVHEFGWDSATCHFAGADAEKQVGFFFGTHIHSCMFGYSIIHPLVRNLVYEGLGLGNPAY